MRKIHKLNGEPNGTVADAPELPLPVPPATNAKDRAIKKQYAKQIKSNLRLNI
jgi:hypothetical protein